MTTKNIFAGVGVRTTFVNILYDELMKREFVTLADVMCIKRGKPKGFYDNNPKATLSREIFYGDLKKASSEVVKALEQACPGCIEAKGFYQEYFKNIIGVTHEKDAKVEQVVIRTKSEYLHGLLLTKPLHHSQKEILPFGEHDGQWYGEVTLSIEPNRELRGRILMYGEGLEVSEPLTLREQIKEVIMKQMNQYADKK